MLHAAFWHKTGPEMASGSASTKIVQFPIVDSVLKTVVFKEHCAPLLGLLGNRRRACFVPPFRKKTPS